MSELSLVISIAIDGYTFYVYEPRILYCHHFLKIIPIVGGIQIGMHIVSYVEEIQ